MSCNGLQSNLLKFLSKNIGRWLKTTCYRPVKSVKISERQLVTLQEIFSAPYETENSKNRTPFNSYVCPFDHQDDGDDDRVRRFGIRGKFLSACVCVSCHGHLVFLIGHIHTKCWRLSDLFFIARFCLNRQGPPTPRSSSSSPDNPGNDFKTKHVLSWWSHRNRPGTFPSHFIISCEIHILGKQMRTNNRSHGQGANLRLFRWK